LLVCGWVLDGEDGIFILHNVPFEEDATVVGIEHDATTEGGLGKAERRGREESGNFDVAKEVEHWWLTVNFLKFVAESVL
jgi:hypothetical protein